MFHYTTNETFFSSWCKTIKNLQHKLSFLSLHFLLYHESKRKYESVCFSIAFKWISMENMRWYDPGNLHFLHSRKTKYSNILGLLTRWASIKAIKLVHNGWFPHPRWTNHPNDCKICIISQKLQRRCSICVRIHFISFLFWCPLCLAAENVYVENSL